MEKPKSNMPGVEQLNGMSVEERVELGKKHVEERMQVSTLKLRIDTQLSQRKDLSLRAKGKLSQKLFEEGSRNIHKNLFS